ncbi:hypothetical protein TNCV_214481 [Trichonephila clavipes]|nr:hypothetical protein TNCV_214481 [Trichonephila clavipes]
MAIREQFPECGTQECPSKRRVPIAHAPRAANNSVCRHLLRGDSGSVRSGESALNTGGLQNKQNKIILALEDTMLDAVLWCAESRPSLDVGIESQP